ncbi:aspartate kinase [Paenactinomyces guangxiensis]|uniref:Aspartokinase n=1 Tax=Paenactinomyces guangxiensis TaxID=1490290 RepID=A0A7W2A901_9BACL|nr:aspartate kinase [Paenactinomyces guangxiensis]MBA4494388.1 aspartate kinase [Paenactinomyces guangxiensis]MBH8591557.1 aspartate kinase [Paenactinomyces guangxiensis]
MRILVQKFGGTSVASPELRERVLYHIKRGLAEGYHLVVVVSAMGRSGDPYATDTLLSLVKQYGNQISPREQDLLMSCGEIISATTLSSLLYRHEIENCVLTGGQAGIITNNHHTNAHIVTINSKRILRQLEKRKVVIVAGFQGQTVDGEITTLGRGGSDTTATALGVALHAECVDIFTDVEGIMTADPRIVEDAAPLEKVTYTEMCNLAFQGAKVIHPRAVEIAMQTNVPIRVRSTMSDHPGTLVTTMSEADRLIGEMRDGLITGITQMPNVTQVRVPAKQGQYDIQLKVFKAMAENDISVDFISVNPSGIAYTVYDDLADRAEEILRRLDLEPELNRNCAKVSTVGAGIAGVPGVMAKIVEALTEEDIQILQSADSHTTIWVLVRGSDMVKAVRALHHKFSLHRLNYS